MAVRKRVGITQRCDLISERDEWRDAIDLRLTRFVWESGFLPIPLTSGVTNAREYLDLLDLDGFVLSGGGDVGEPRQRADLEDEILNYSASTETPVFGICRGMQVLIVASGGSLQVLKGHVANRHQIKGALASGHSVNSFHSLGILGEDLPPELIPLAYATDGTVEAVKHIRNPWTGVMWHPERDDPTRDSDKQLLKESMTQRAVK